MVSYMADNSDNFLTQVLLVHVTIPVPFCLLNSSWCWTSIIRTVSLTTHAHSFYPGV